MKILKNKQGIGLPMVLGIIVFVIGITASMMSYIVFQSKIVEIDIKQTEDYQKFSIRRECSIRNYLKRSKLRKKFS